MKTYCPMCEKDTDQIRDTSQKTLTDGKIVFQWWQCTECETYLIREKMEVENEKERRERPSLDT